MDFNTIVIGAGPAGLASALYLKRAGIDVLLIDKDAPGGQLLKTSMVENYLGFESINGAELALKMFNHVKANDIPLEFAEVLKVEKKGYFVVKTNKKDFKCKHLIIATGRVPAKLKIKDIDNIQGISYCAVCDGTFYKEKTVGVVGGGNSAFTNALYLADLCKQVYVFVRNEVKADLELINRAKNKGNIVVLKGNEINELMTENNVIKGVVFDDGKIIKVDGLFVAIGGKPNISFIDGLELEKGYIKVNNKMETSLKNVYACGDVILKDFYQIATAVSDGAIAALTIKEND